MKREREEQMDPIPYIEDSFLSKIFVKYRTLPLLDFFLFFFIGIPHIQGSFPQPTHTTMGGLFAFGIDSSMGLIATFFHSKGNRITFSQSIGALLPSVVLSKRAERTFGTSVGQAV